MKNTETFLYDAARYFDKIEIRCFNPLIFCQTEHIQQCKKEESLLRKMYYTDGKNNTANDEMVSDKIWKKPLELP